MSPMAAPTLMGLFLMISRSMASSQFVIIQETKTYDEASAYCARTYGTTLATIRNDYDANDLLELRQDLGSDHTWVGLKVNSAGEWKWDSGFACDGDCQSIRYWDNGQPQANTEECAVIHGNVNEIDNLHDVPCTNTYPQFACDVPVMGLRMVAVEEGLTTANTKVSAVETEVDEMKTKVSDVEEGLTTMQLDVDAVESLVSLVAVDRYKMIKKTTTYQEASDYCATTYGTTLATIRSNDDVQELFALRQALGGDGSYHTWVGLRANSEDVWEWDSGYPCDGGDCLIFEYWDDGQPNSGDQDCTVIHKNVNDMENLHDVPCTGWTADLIACDTPFMETRVEVTSNLQSMTALASLGAERYTMTVSTTTYQEASDYCATTYGTSLATIRNEADSLDLLALRQALGLDGVYHAWIGLTANSEGVYEWDSGYPCDGGDCQSIKYWDDGQPNSGDQDCTVIHKNVNDMEYLHDVPCTDWTATAFACDTPFMVTRMRTTAVEEGLTSVNSEVTSLQTRLESLERIMDGFYDTLGDEQSVSAPVGFGVYADYALYALALSNLVVLLCLFAFCMVRRVPTKVQYGRVYDTETEADKL